jgi:CHAD domain-containing protein
MNGPQQPAERTPDKSVIEVALSTLDDRLKAVRKRFAQAVRHGGKNAERVHQLRVATRRAAAALGLYHDLVPRKIAKRMDARLKRIRRTAGDIRDCDMLLARFSSEVAQAESPSFIKRTDSQRVAAYRDLCRLHQNHSSSGRLKRQTRKLLAKTRHKAERRPRLATQKFDAWAPERLRLFVNEFFEAAAPDLRDFSQLHRFRIRSKALRYAMELVASTFPPEFKNELYPVIQRLQTLLGNINDEANFLKSVGTRLANQAKPGDVDGLKHRMAQEQHALDELEREFSDWWTTARREMLQRRFEEMIAPRAA